MCQATWWFFHQKRHGEAIALPKNRYIYTYPILTVKLEGRIASQTITNNSMDKCPKGQMKRANKGELTALASPPHVQRWGLGKQIPFCATATYTKSSTPLRCASLLPYIDFQFLTSTAINGSHLHATDPMTHLCRTATAQCHLYAPISGFWAVTWWISVTRLA